MPAKKGCIPWNKDLKLSEEQKAKLNLEGLNIRHPWNKGKIGIYSEEYLQKLRESHMGKTGVNSSNWKGGLSFEPYGIEFNKKLKRQVRERDNFTCQMTGCNKKENGRDHDVHHVDYNKKNNNEDNLITLCMNCHMKTNGNRKYWTFYFQNLLKFNSNEVTDALFSG